MPFADSSSTASEREERIFTAAFGIMDSSQDGEAIAAFMRVREILHRHGGGFRHLLERSHEADRLNEQLGQQNAQLLRENAALHARDSRPIPAAETGARRLLSALAVREFAHWDAGLIIIIATWTALGLLSASTALTLCAAVLISGALTNWFSPVRLYVGTLVALTAYGMVASAPASMPPATTAMSPVANAAPTHQPDTSFPVQTFADSSQRIRAAADSPLQSAGDLRTRPAAKVDCGSYQLQPGFTCARRNQWRWNSF